MLFAALSLFAASNLAFALVPHTVARVSEPLDTWAPLAARLTAALLFAAAAFVPPLTVRRPQHACRRALAGVSVFLGGVAGATMLLGPHLPDIVDETLAPELSSRTFVAGDPIVVAAQLAALCLFALAAVGFVRKARREDPLRRLLGVAAVLQATASLNYVLFPSLYSEWVYTGDAFRLTFYAVLLVACASEVRAYWQRLADAAALDERRRIARDLHDGAAQELAFVATQARLAVREPGHATLEALAAAADRALDESRRAIDALTAPAGQTLDVAIARAAELVAHRMGARVRLDLPEGFDADPATREDLIRIVREAVTNAVRHGRAGTISVSLTPVEGRMRLRVADAGRGFTPESATGGFGLKSMRERAARINGTLTIASVPGAGTTVDVLV